MANEEDEAPDDPALAAALADVPKATTAGGEDVWGHEGRSRLDREEHGESAPAAPMPLTPPIVAAPPEPSAGGGSRKAMVLGGLAALGAVLALGLYATGSSGPSAPAPEAANKDDGVLEVRTEPAGAEILLDGKPTGQRTDGRVEGLPTDKPARISVRMAGFISSPATQELIPTGRGKVDAIEFSLKRARTLELTTEPPGADVSLDGARLGGKTPITLPPLELGKRANVQLALAGHLPVELELRIDAATATRTQVALELGRPIAVSSEPSGATVTIDGKRAGVTPLTIAVPATREFSLRLERPGFAPHAQKLRGKDAPERLEIELTPIPLRKLPLTPDELSRLDGIEKELAKLRGELSKAEAALKRSSAALARAKDPSAYASDTTELESEVSKGRVRVEELSAHLDEQKAQLVRLRDEIVDRVGQP